MLRNILATLSKVNNEVPPKILLNYSQTKVSFKLAFLNENELTAVTLKFSTGLISGHPPSCTTPAEATATNAATKSPNMFSENFEIVQKLSLLCLMRSQSCPVEH